MLLQQGTLTPSRWAIWVAVGAQKTLLAGLGWLPAILLGVVTAVGGGAVRDIALRRIPTVLGGNTLYATCALAAAAVVVVLQLAGRQGDGLVIGTAVGSASIRSLSIISCTPRTGMVLSSGGGPQLRGGEPASVSMRRFSSAR